MRAVPAGARAAAAFAAGALALFLLYALTASYDSRQPNDAIGTFLASWQLAWHGTLQLPEYVDNGVWVVEGPWGALSNRLPGAIVFAVPFYRLLGSPDGPAFYPAAIAAAAATAGGVAAAFAATRRVVPAGVALGAAGLLAFGTGAWTAAANALWTHGPNMLWLALAMLALSRHRPAWAGLALAAAIFTRPHLAFAAAGCGLWLTWRARSLRPALAVAATSSLGVVALVVWNGLVWDRWAPLAGGYAGKVEAATGSGPWTVAERWAGTLVSPERGVLVYSPFLLLLVPGLRAAWRAAPAWVQAGALGGLAYLVAQLQQNGFGGGGGFVSNRLVLETLTLSAPLLALSWAAWTARRRWRRAAFAVLAAAAVFQHAVGAFVGRDYRGLRDHWSTYVVGERLADGTVVQLAGLAVVMVVAVALLLEVAGLPVRRLTPWRRPAAPPAGPPAGPRSTAAPPTPAPAARTSGPGPGPAAGGSPAPPPR